MDQRYQLRIEIVYQLSLEGAEGKIEAEYAGGGLLRDPVEVKWGGF